MFRFPNLRLPRNYPSSLSRRSSCSKCYESLTRCLSHFWFCTLCCSYVIISSFTRCSAILDFILSFLIYVLVVKPNLLSISQFIHVEFTGFKFSKSLIDVVIISFIRSIILFFCYAYRYQRDGYTTPIIVSLASATISSFYLVAKFASFIESSSSQNILNTPNTPKEVLEPQNQLALLIFSFLYVQASFGLFLCVRRRRIRMQPPQLSSVKIRRGRKNDLVAYRALSSPDQFRNSGASSSASGDYDAITNIDKQSRQLSKSSDYGENINTRYIRSHSSSSSESDRDGKIVATSNDYKSRLKTKNKKINTVNKSNELCQSETPLKLNTHIKSVKRAHGSSYKSPRPYSTASQVELRSLTTIRKKSSSQELNHSQKNSQLYSDQQAHNYDELIAEKCLSDRNSRQMEVFGVRVHYVWVKNSQKKVEEDIDDRDLEEEADENGITFVLLHGFGGGVFSQRQIIPALSKYGRGVLAFDRPGFGLTQKPLNQSNDKSKTTVSKQSNSSESDVNNSKNNEKDDDNPYSSSFSVKLTLEIIRRLNLHHVILVGHSTGASLACSIALKCSCDNVIGDINVEGLVLLAQSCGLLPNFVRSILKTRLGSSIIMRLVRSELGDVAIRRAQHNPDIISPDIIRNYKQCIKVRHWNEALIEMSRVKQDNSIFDIKQLAELDCRVLIIHGDDDKLVSISDSQRLVKKFRLAEFVAIPECGHIPHEECPKQFLTELLAFYKKVNPVVRLTSTFKQKQSMEQLIKTRESINDISNRSRSSPDSKKNSETF